MQDITRTTDTIVKPENTNNNPTSVVIKPRFSLRPVQELEVCNVIDSLKNKFSCGLDEIPTSVLKNSKTYLCPVLTHIINSSFVSGIFPDKLKISKVVPIFKKKGDKQNIVNYRPISLISNISKIFEKIVCNQLTEYLDNNKLLDEIQHGFRCNRSVTTAAVDFVSTIIESVDQGDHTVGIFMDLSKAFDSVKHSTLIKKLEFLGISNNSLAWFQSYLNNRYQRVEITFTSQKFRVTKMLSDLQPIKFGVPQGSILGPLLFICYLKDIELSLANNLQSRLCLYADDSNLKITGKTIEQIELLSKIELENIENYFNFLNLGLNINKTNFVYFRTPQNKNIQYPELFCDGQVIERKKSTNFLGLVIDETLSWDQHIQGVLSKINSGIYALSKMSVLCDLATLRVIYFSFIHSHIAFGISLYGSATKTSLDIILKSQKKAIRIMLKLKKMNLLGNISKIYKF